jgi:hypothetical protein
MELENWVMSESVTTHSERDIALAILWESARNFSSLPTWMTERKPRGSVLDLVVVVAFILMVTVEQRWILNLKPSSVASPTE